MESPIAAVYADGGCMDRNPSPLGGTFAWCHVDSNGQRINQGSGLVLATPKGLLKAVTNNQSEFYALLSGLEAVPEGWHGMVYSDSRCTLGRFFWSYAMKGIPDEWIGRMRALYRRLNRPLIQAVLLSGHPTRAQLAAGVGKGDRPVSIHNVWCDQECSRIARERREAIGVKVA